MRGLEHTCVGDLSFELVATNVTNVSIRALEKIGVGAFGDNYNVAGEHVFIDGEASFREAALQGENSFTIPPGSYAPREAGSSDLEKISSFSTTFAGVPVKC